MSAMVWRWRVPIGGDSMGSPMDPQGKNDGDL